jgi:poly(hydroxyalkanoate) depolymerase family esterase
MVTEGGTSTTTTYEGRTVIVHVPSTYAHGTAVPLVVMLHGCTQTPSDFETGTQMDVQADMAGFIAAYPEEPSSANSEECWNWFLPADQARGSGEPQLLANIVGDLGKDYSIDPNRVFAAGLSAGAAMAVVVGATYPDVFAAIGVSAGLEYEAATDESSAISASENGGPDPTTQGDLAFTAMGPQARSVPVIVFHGDADQVVNVTNGTQVVSQWSETDTRAQASVGPAVVTMGSAGGKTFTHTTYADGTSGKSLLELYVVHGMGHAWSGGSSAGSYTDPDAPDASALAWQFFAAHGR